MATGPFRILFGWALLAMSALAVSVVSTYVDTWGRNYGQTEAEVIDVIVAARLLFPYMWLGACLLLYRRQEPALQTSHGRTVALLGIVCWLAIIAMALVADQIMPNGKPSELFVGIWYALGLLVFLLPLGGLLLRTCRSWPPQWSRAAALLAGAIGLVLAGLPYLDVEDTHHISLGEPPAFAFGLVLLFLGSFASSARIWWLTGLVLMFFGAVSNPHHLFLGGFFYSGFAFVLSFGVVVLLLGVVLMMFGQRSDEVRTGR